jgi:AraC-like DNA-binding protein
MGVSTTLFALGAANSLALAGLLARERANRLANRLLAALLLLVALRLCIYALGFAGAYDAHPWLSFLPLDGSAGFAPLLWLYVGVLTGPLPPHWRLHLIPMALQFAYQGACFALPLELKWAWYSGVHLAWVEPAAMAAILCAAAAYLLAAWRDQAAYQHWLDQRYADRERWRLGWLRTMLAAFALLVAAAAAAALWHAAVAPLDYFARIPVMLGGCLVAYVLGLAGWRHGTVDYPRRGTEAPPERGERVDYAAVAERLIARIDAAGWWREEGLTLATVAARLNVSERSLSRALNDGAGRSFNATVNGLRIAAIQKVLADPAERRDLLTLALDHGFAAKASFNRAFRDATGTTPSRWRRDIRQSAPSEDFGTTRIPH